MAKIELLDEQPLNITMSEPQTINETIAPQENINVETTEGWYEKNYTETDPVYSRSAASSITEQDIDNWDNKQDGLISGTNIKTINNQSILGSGNITIQGGGTGNGDMLKSVYDTNDNGIVDNAEKVNNHTVEKDVPSNAKFTDTVYDDTNIRQTLDSKADSSDIPTKTSDLTNDSGFITEHQDISGKVDKIEGKGLSTNDYTDSEKSKVSEAYSKKHTHSNMASLNLITDDKINTWNSKSDFSGSYTDLTDKPVIPTVGNAKTYYGTSDTSASTAAKVVTCSDFVLETGATIFVKFTNANTYNGTSTLNVNSTGAKDIARVGATKTTRYYWTAGEVVGFVYDGTNYVMIDKGTATTSYYGMTKLSSSTTSTSEALAATSKAVKTAYDLANSKQDEITSTNKLDYSLIDNTPTIPTIPTNLSSFTDDLGSSPTHTHSQYLTSHQDISGKVDKETGKGLSSNDFTTTYKNNVESNTTARHTHSNKSVLDGISSSDITNWNNKSTFSGNYNDLTNKPTIPDELSDLSDDSTHRLVTDTEKSTWNAKQVNTIESISVNGTPVIIDPNKNANVNIKTINGDSLLGSGNISLETIEGIDESSIHIRDLYAGVYRIDAGTSGRDIYYNSTDSLSVSSMNCAYLIVSEAVDLYSVKNWVFIGTGSPEFRYGYSWNNNGNCYNVTSVEAQAAITGILSNLTTTAKTNLVSAINELDSDKQDTLVSGTNIKTINNQSILGSGNISLPTSSDIPTKTSDLINDSGYIIGIKDVIGVSKTSATTNYSTNKQGFLPFISTGNYSIDARIGTDLTWTTKSVSFEDVTDTTYGISIPSGVSLVKVETNVRYQNPASSQININTMIFRDRNGTSTSARAMSQSVPGSSRYTCNFATYISVQEGDFIYIGSWKSTASANVSVSNVDNATGVMLEVIQ